MGLLKTMRLLPLRVYREETLRSFLFLQFLSLIIFAHLKRCGVRSRLMMSNYYEKSKMRVYENGDSL